MSVFNPNDRKYYDVTSAEDAFFIQCGRADLAQSALVVPPPPPKVQPVVYSQYASTEDAWLASMR